MASRWDFEGLPKRLAAGQVPDEAYVSWRHSTLPDFGLVNAWWAVSERVRDYLRLLEPGGIQFVPFRISRRKAGKEMLGSDGAPINCFYLMNVLVRADPIVIDRSPVDVSGSTPPFVTLRPGRAGEVVLSKNLIQGHHIWQGCQHMPNDTFISDHLAEWLVNEGFDHYFKMTHMQEI